LTPSRDVRGRGFPIGKKGRPIASPESDSGILVVERPLVLHASAEATVAEVPIMKLLAPTLVRSLPAALVCAVLAFAQIAGGQPIEPLVLEGDAVPDVSGAVFDALGPPVVNDGGQVAFQASYDAGAGGTGSGIFLYSNGMLSTIAAIGDAAPDTGGGIFAGFLDPALNASGELAFVATMIGGTTNMAVFLYSGGTLTPLARIFDPAPLSGGGSFAGFQAPLGLSASGEAIFHASVSTGSFTTAIYGMTTIGSRLIVSNGQAAPSPLVGTYFSLGTPGVNASGEVVVSTFLNVPTFTPAVVHFDAVGDDAVIALKGDPAPATSGGTFNVFSLTQPAINDDGDVAFQSSVTGGSAANGLFVFEDGSGSAAALPGDPAPDTGGETYGQPVLNPTLDGAASVGFRNHFVGAAGREGIFRDVGGVDELIAVDGDDAPGVPGSVFDEFPNPPAQSPLGLIVFNATTSGDSAINGIFSVPEPSAGLALGIGAGMLAALARRRS
jgi:hypothetical protein